MAKTKEVKLTLTINGKDIPINGDLMHSIDRNGNLILKFNIGTVKLDKVELKLEQLNYIKEIKDEKPNDN